MTLADCFFTMVLILAPLGATSQFEGMQLRGSCQSNQISTLVNADYQLVITTEWERYVIPLPLKKDRIRLSYKMQSAYAYLGDCRYGLKPYHFFDSSCQRVMVRYGPRESY